jgi:hemerythrin
MQLALPTVTIFLCCCSIVLAKGMKIASDTHQFHLLIQPSSRRRAMTAETEIHRHAFVVEWREGFKINVPQVDEEHKHLFALVKALNLETVDQTLQELLDYVVTHFSNEQALMEKHGYPAFEAHLQLHEVFGTQVADFLSSGEDWSEDRIQNLRRFLNKWLIGHIMTHDLRFGKWLESQNSVVVPIKRDSPAEKKGFFARLFGRH